MNKTSIRSFNAEFFLQLLFGLLFLGFLAVVFFGALYRTDRAPYFFLVFGAIAIAFSLKKEIRTIDFDEQGIFIHSDFGWSDKVQLKYEFAYDDINCAFFGEIQPNKNTENQSIRPIYIWARYSVTKCIVFSLKSGDTARLITNKFTKAQIYRIIDEMLKRNLKIEHLENKETFIHHHSNDVAEPHSNKMLKYPLLLGLVTVIGSGLFLFFMYSNFKYGGSAASDEVAASYYEGYVEGSYYLSDHGRYTEVTLEVWNYMSVLETLMFISYFIMVVSNGLFILVIKKKHSS